MRVVAVVGLVLFLSLLAQPAVSQVPDDQLIVPGQRIGKWTLNMTINDLLKMNGPRSGIKYKDIEQQFHLDMASKDFWEHHWDPLYALTLGRDSQKVMALAIERGYEEKIQYKTAKGIGPGSSQKDLNAAYKGLEPMRRPTAVTMAEPGYQVFTVIFDKIGLAAWVWGPGEVYQAPGTIVTMIVFRPGTAKSIWKY